MTDIKLQETDFVQKSMRYRFLNAHDHPLKKQDYTELSRANILFYNRPLSRDDEYYDEPELLYGKMAYEFGKYFFAEGTVEKLQGLGYTVILDSLDEQRQREAVEKERRLKIKRRNAIAENLFDFIRKNGFQPAGQNSPQGEEIETPETRNSHTRIYGGGRWFNIDKDAQKIWAIQNNGGDGDCWAYNNVITGGAGAYGSFVPYTEEIEQMIRITTLDAQTLSEEQLTYTDPVFTADQQTSLQELKDAQEAERKRKEEEAIILRSETLFTQPADDVIKAIFQIREGTFVPETYSYGITEPLYNYNKEKFNDPDVQAAAILAYKAIVVKNYQTELAEDSYYKKFKGEWDPYHHALILKVGLKDEFEAMWNAFEQQKAERDRIRKEKEEAERKAREEEWARQRAEIKAKREQFIDTIRSQTKEDLLLHYTNCRIMKSWTKTKILETIAEQNIS